MTINFKQRLTSFFKWFRKKQDNKEERPIDYKERLDKILNTFYSKKRGMWTTVGFPSNFEDKHFHSAEVPGTNEGNPNIIVQYHFRRFTFSKDKPTKITYHYYTYTKEEGVKEFEINEENAELYQYVYEMFIAQYRIQPILKELKYIE